jgi:hypothetical protein
VALLRLHGGLYLLQMPAGRRTPLQQTATYGATSCSAGNRWSLEILHSDLERYRETVRQKEPYVKLMEYYHYPNSMAMAG